MNDEVVHLSNIFALDFTCPNQGFINFFKFVRILCVGFYYLFLIFRNRLSCLKTRFGCNVVVVDYD